MGRSLLPMHCDLFEVYYAPRKLILKCEYADKILLIGLFFQAGGSLTSLKSQTRDPGGLVLRRFTF